MILKRPIRSSFFRVLALAGLLAPASCLAGPLSAHLDVARSSSSSGSFWGHDAGAGVALHMIGPVFVGLELARALDPGGSSVTPTHLHTAFLSARGNLPFHFGFHLLGEAGIGRAWRTQGEESRYDFDTGRTFSRTGLETAWPAKMVGIGLATRSLLGPFHLELGTRRVEFREDRIRKSLTEVRAGVAL
jgi:hypothetical protein